MTSVFQARRLQEIGILAIAVFAVQWALSKWVFPILGSWFSPVSMGSLIMSFLVIFGSLIAGFWIYEQRWAWKGKNMTQRLWAILFYGAIALWAVLLLRDTSTLSSSAFPLAISIGINAAIIALVLGFSSKYLKFLRI